MSGKNQLLRLYGSEEDTGRITSLSAGPLVLEIDRGTLRNIRWNDVELIRAINYPIRDPNWGTVSDTTKDETIEQRADGWRYQRLFVSSDQALEGQLVAAGTASGKLTIDVSFTATADYRTTRTGFTVLHPLDGLAGGDVDVTHSEGTVERLVFPKRISPSQPVFDIAALAYTIRGARANIVFDGDVFEMEDQRNWTDASYKTYCRPLGWPSPFTIESGNTLRQRITVTFSQDGRPQVSSVGPADNRVGTLADVTRLPEIVLALEPGFLPDDPGLSLVRNLEIPRCAARVVDSTESTGVADIIEALGTVCDLEVVSADDARDADEQMAAIARVFAAKGIYPEHVVAVPRDYLKNYQPDGEWPDGLTPQDAVGLARKAFPKSKVGSGVLTNFTEFNRCRPVPEACDFVTHGSTPIVHAADDISVFQTLEGLQDVYASVRALAPDAKYRLGLASIGMRSNPYGPAPTANPVQIRLEMAQADPRQRGLFAAAWMVGVMAATKGFDIDSIALAMPVGPLGVVYRKEHYPQPLFDGDGNRHVYPAYHVLKALAQIGGKPGISIPMPSGLFCVACQMDDRVIAIVSNGTPGKRAFDLPDHGDVLVLDEESFDDATTDGCWLNKADRQRLHQVELGPYAVAFAEIPSVT